MAKGPLVVRFGGWTLDDPQAGALATARVEVENAGTVPWRDEIRLAYHWLDDRGNPIVWDGLRTPTPALAPGERATVEARVRAPIPPGRYRFALDLVAENRAGFSELGSEMATPAVEVPPRSSRFAPTFPAWAAPAPGYEEAVAAAHAEGYAVVAPAIAWDGRRPRALEPYAPGGGRNPRCSHALVSPSVVEGVELERVADVEGLPAFVAPEHEPWIYDARAVVRAAPRRR